MPEQKKSSKPIVTIRKVHGRQVEYRKTESYESLLIDGIPVRFFRVGKDYQLEKNAYGKEMPTLLEAAEAYLESRATDKN